MRSMSSLRNGEISDELAVILEPTRGAGNLERASVKLKMERLLEAHASLSGWSGHDIPRRHNGNFGRASQTVQPKGERQVQLHETRGPLKAEKIEPRDVQRTAAENAALQEKVERGLRLLVHEKDRRLMDMWRRVEDAVEQSEQARSQAAEKDLRLAAQQERLSGLEQALVDERQRSSVQAAEIADLQASLAERESDFAALQASLAEREGDVATLQASLAGRKDEITALQASLAEREGDVATLRASLAERDSEVAALQAFLAEREGDVATLQASLAERDSDIVGLQSEAVILRQEVVVVVGQLDQAGSAVKTLTRSVSDLHASGSWRVTYPLRLVYGALRSAFLWASQVQKQPTEHCRPSADNLVTKEPINPPLTEAEASNHRDDSTQEEKGDSTRSRTASN